MTPRTAYRGRLGVAVALAAFVAGCSSSNLPPIGVSPTPTRTVTPLPTATPTATSGSAAVTGVVVLQRDVAAGAPEGLGAPPPGWVKGADSASFDRAVSNADWSIDGVAVKQGVTGPDGRFDLGDLAPGRYTLHVSKTLQGNLLPLSIPFAVGDGGAEVVAEVAWGLVRATSTYTVDGVQVREVLGPYGSHVYLHDGRVVELGDPSRTIVDSDGDGRFEPLPCPDHVWECPADGACGDGRKCSCTASCPACDDCGPGVCVPPAQSSPYRCSPGGTCAEPGDTCLCVSSCPQCDDCTRSVCVPGCLPLEIAAVSITNGPSQLVVGRQGQVYAAAVLSDGSTIDVTYLADWQSSDDTVASVDSWGTVSAHAIGLANLTATIGTLHSAPWPVTVVDRPTLQRISVYNQFCYCGPVALGGPESGIAVRPCILNAPTAVDLLPIPGCGQVVQIGATLQFTAVGEYADGSYDDLTKAVQWEVAPAAVGDAVAGLFTARQAGTAQLTASLGAVVSDPTEIRVVTQPTVVGLSIYADSGVFTLIDGGPVPGVVVAPCSVGAGSCCCPSDVKGDAVGPCVPCGYSITVLQGDQLQFHATAQYDTGEWREVTDQVAWRSSNAAATIDAAGAMAAAAAGDVTIDAVLDTVTSNPVGVHIVDHATLQSITIYQESGGHVVAKGDQRFFHASGYYDVGFARDVTKRATWRSSNESVGKFDTPGAFTARGAGSVQVWAELDGLQSQPVSLEVYELSELTYCDPQHINRAVWSDDYNRVTLESDCASYTQPGVATLRYTVAETQPHGGIFDPCLDLYVYQGKTRVRTIREEGCGAPFAPAGAPGQDAAVLKYQLRAFWDLKDDNGAPVPSATYTIYGRFYLYYDPVVSIDVSVGSPGGPGPSPTPFPVCTPPLCGAGEVFYCSDKCPGGCGTICATPTPVPVPVSLEAGSAEGVPGDQVSFTVSLHTAGRQVAGTQNDLIFDPSVAIAANANGRPDCTVNPGIDKGATAFVFLPPGCRAGIDCKSIRALVVAVDNTDPIPDVTVLYTCNVNIGLPVAPGTYALLMVNVSSSNPRGVAWRTTGTDGAITVLLPGGTPPPKRTPTPTSTPTATPQVEGACFIGSSICTGSPSLTSQYTCCVLSRSTIALATSWCPVDQLDTSTGQCVACASTPCEGCSCTDLFACVCDGAPPPSTARPIP